MSFQSYTYAAGRGVTSLSPSLPTNDSSMVMFAVHSVIREDSNNTSPVCTAPAGWTLVVDNGSLGLGVYRALWRKVGDGSTGTITWSYDVAIRGEVVLLCYSELNTTTPVDASAFKNESSLTSTHTTTSVTSSLANSPILGIWASGDTGISFFESADLPNTRVNLDAPSGSATRPLLITDAIQAVAGASGAKSTTSNSNSFCQMISAVLKPAPNPSVPVLTYPNGDESLTTGAAVAITWTQSTSPTAAQASLKYNLDYSANNGASWTSIVALSSVGVSSYSWTVPATLGNGYLIRIRAYDPALTIYSLAYDQSDAAFSVVAETAPTAPTGLSPNSTYPAQNKASVVTLAWTHGGGSGNPQTQFTLQWSTNGGAAWTTVGPTTTATQSTTIDFSAQAVGTTITWRVKTQGVSLYSAYSNNVAFVVASLPTTPNITAPTAGSPPSVPQPAITHTITSGETQASRRIRIVQGGVEAYNSGWETTGALSVTSPYAFANGGTYALYLAIRNQYGLESAEDSETFTASYSGPAAPTITATNVDAAGYVLLKITNSDTPAYNEIWRYAIADGIATAIRIATNLAKNASFLDYNSPTGSADPQGYFARAYSGGLYTDSAPTSSVTLTIVSLWIHAVSRDSTSSNAEGSAVALINIAPADFSYLEQQATHELLGRSKPVSVSGQAVWQVLKVTAITPFTSSGDLTNLMAIYRQNTTVCARNILNDRIFGVMSEPQITGNARHYSVSFTVTELDYGEGL